MKVVFTLTKAEAAAVLRSEGLTNGHGVIKSQALRAAEMKIVGAVQSAAIDCGAVPPTPEEPTDG